MTFLELLLKTAEAPIKVQQGRGARTCWVCKDRIVPHEIYHDGGHGKRAHRKCLTEAANRLAKAMNDYVPPKKIQR